MVVYLVALALQQPADLSVEYPEFYPLAAGIGSSIKKKNQNRKIKNGWMEFSLLELFFTVSA